MASTNLNSAALSGDTPSQALGTSQALGKQKNGNTASLRQGNTAEITKMLNKEEQDEAPVAAGGCLGQFWGTNRPTKKKEMPRAPKITAPVIESKGAEGLGVRVGCW